MTESCHGRVLNWMQNFCVISVALKFRTTLPFIRCTINKENDQIDEYYGVIILLTLNATNQTRSRIREG